MSDNSPRSENIEDLNDLFALASAAAPLRNLNFIDYLYGNSVPLYYGGGGDGYGEAGDSVASILARSLYDHRPVKKVITEEAQREIIDKKFTATMVEKLKINDACGIWQEPFEEGEDIKILPCNHAFKADAIMKWLNEEKAECPICRFSLKSKEVVDNHDHYAVPRPYEDEDEDEVEYEPAPAPAPAPAPVQESNGNRNISRVNNIASRLAQSVAGSVNPNFHRDHNYRPHHSISVPMNQLLQSMRMISSSVRPREPVRAAVPISQESYANVGREVRAEAMQHHSIRENNNAVAAAAAAGAAPANIYINNNSYSYNYNYNDELHRFITATQEQNDINEAIRRSLC
jgi:hypothetical protein